jgi:hypothetical protein
MAHCAAYLWFPNDNDLRGWVELMQKVSHSVRSTHGQDGAIVLDVQQGQMFNLNLVGSRILELLKIGSSEQQITSTISQEFSADTEIVRKDLAEFLEELRKHKLVDAAASGEF